MAELHPNLEQKELEAPGEQDLLEAGHGETNSAEPQTEAQQQTAMAEAAREAVDRHISASEEIKLTHPEQDADKTDFQLTRELKEDKYVKVIAAAQSQLKSAEKRFSRVIHQPVIERLSTSAADTVARPSGLLGGSIGALIGSVIVLFSAKHYGFAYNFLLFLFLFAAGFFAGLVFEVGYNILRKNRP